MNSNELNKYIDRFFEEKEFDIEDFELHDSEGMYHFVPLEVVKEFIKNLDLFVKNQIVQKIRKIDFFNGRVEDFLKYIAQGMIEV